MGKDIAFLFPLGHTGVMNKQELKMRVREAIERDPSRNAIRRVSLFGSYAKETARDESDVDLLIEFFPGSKMSFFTFFDIRENIENHIQKKVDLLTPEALSKHFRKDVLEKSEIVYG